MKTFNSSIIPVRVAAMALVVAATLAGCGGTRNESPPPPVVVVPDISKSIADLFDYMTTLVASLSDSADPVDVNMLTLAVDDTAEPSVLK